MLMTRQREAMFIKAFTLVELLVVIAIISVLAGMLMPALENAIGASRSVTCMNNQKQIGSVFSFYISDNDGWQVVIVDHEDPNSANYPNGCQKCYAYYLRTYFDMEWNVSMPISGPTIFICGEANLLYTDSEVKNICYGYNQVYANNGASPYIPPKIINNNVPSETMLLSDGWVYQSTETTKTSYYPYRAPWNAQSGAYIAYNDVFATLGEYTDWAWRHNEMLNMLYIDGHVKTCEERYDGRPAGFRFSDNVTNYCKYWD